MFDVGMALLTPERCIRQMHPPRNLDGHCTNGARERGWKVDIKYESEDLEDDVSVLDSSASGSAHLSLVSHSTLAPA